MSQSKKKKKVIVTTSKESKESIGVTKSKYTGLAHSSDGTTSEFLFGKKNFMFMFGGIALIALGMLLMTGGHMPNDNVWDESIIYSTRRTLIAPIVILAGLVLQIYAIFSKR